MSNIQEMFLKAADFQIIEKPPIGLDQFGVIGFRIKTKGEKYGSYIHVCWPLKDEDRAECVELMKELALDTILMLVGCHA